MMSDSNPYQPPLEQSELIKPAIDRKRVKEATPTYGKEALYFAMVAGIVFLLAFGFVVFAQIVQGIVS